MAHAFGALVHCDAVQAAGKIPVDINALGADLLTLSSHKLGGPQGVGALILGKAPGLWLAPLIRGGGQERGLRAGTENVAAIAGFGLAAELARTGLGDSGRLASMRDGLESGIRELAPEAEFFGSATPRLPNTSCFTMPGVLAETQVMAFDLEGVAVSAGAACSSGKVAPSRVLRAMGADEDQAASAIRVSLGWNSKRAHVDHFLQAWGALYSRKRERTAEAA
jgi:cysteine desulfurase